MDWTEVANKVEKLVLAEMVESLEYWNSPTNISIRSMVVGDAAHGLRFCELLANNRLNEAHNWLLDQDTDPREILYRHVTSVIGEVAYDTYLRNSNGNI